MKLLLILVLCFSAQAADLSRLFHAIAKVESSGNPKAVNRKENALGLYQIRPAYFRDAKIGGKHSDVLDPKKAQEVVMAYFRKYEPEALQKGNLEALARLHNAGPNWRKKKSATNEYWNKVKKSLWQPLKISYSFNSWKEINMNKRKIRLNKNKQYKFGIVLPAGEYDAVHILSDVWQVKQNGINLSVTEKQFDFVDIPTIEE